MSSQGVPDPNQRRDVIKELVSSRRALAVIFVLFLLLGILCVWLGGTVPVSIGTSLLASALVSLATLLIDQIRSGEQMRASALATAGLLAAHERRDLPEYEGLVRTANRIDIAGYTLKSFSETSASVLRDKAGAGHAAAVRVLLVDPDCEAARTMEHWERLPDRSYFATSQSVRAKLGDIHGVEIRTIRHALPMMIYRIDDVLFTGPFPSDGQSRMAPTLKLGKRGWLFERHRAEFESLWAKATPVAAAAGARAAAPPLLPQRPGGTIDTASPSAATASGPPHST